MFFFFAKLTQQKKIKIRQSMKKGNRLYIHYHIDNRLWKCFLCLLAVSAFRISLSMPWKTEEGGRDSIVNMVISLLPNMKNSGLSSLLS